MMDKEQIPPCSEVIELLSPADQAEISFLTQEQKDFFSDPNRFIPHDPELKPREIDLTFPGKAIFRWNVQGDSQLQISEDPDFSVFRLYPGKNNQAEISNLMPGKQYFWRVKTEHTLSEVRRFTVAPDHPRWVNIPNVTNCRDIGNWKTADGKKIRAGMIYRGAQFESETEGNVIFITPDGKRCFTEELHIKTELDLRGEEIKSFSPAEKIYPFPLSAYASWGGYGVFTAEQMEYYRQIFELFADPEIYPVYFHCAGGGDRTGTLAFMLEAVLGLDYETLLTEYELSNLSVSGERTRFSEVWKKFMEKLETLSPGGSIHEQVREYLHQCGIPDETLEKIRSILLEP